MPPQSPQDNQPRDPGTLPSPVPPNQPHATPSAPTPPAQQYQSPPLPQQLYNQPMPYDQSDDQPQTGVPQLHPTNLSQAYPPQDVPAEAQDRYAFFMESKPKPVTSLLPIPKKTNKFAWIIIGAVGLFIILGAAAAIISSVRGSQNNGNADTFVSVINQQQEILRINRLATKNIQSPDLANFVATATLTTTSSQQGVIDYVTKHGVKVDTKDLEKYQADPKTDKVLESAQAASVYDSTFRRIMTDMITEYQASLTRISGNASLKSEKELLAKNQSSADLLKTMLTGQ